MSDYKQFLQAKQVTAPAAGIQPGPVNPMAFPFQRDIVAWALRRGRAAIFADCGMGKTFMQLEWARQIPGRVLILAPLAVANQTVREGAKFGIAIRYLRADDGQPGIVITNYEMAQHFEPGNFAGIVLDESSILKSYSGKFRTYLMQQWTQCPYRLACTATPAPNDYMEMGNHCEFLGVMTGSEMLASFFINDPGNVGHYRIKGHASGVFWQWMASWAVMIRKPSDLGYDDGAFVLPPLNLHEVTVNSDPLSEDLLFSIEAHTMEERRLARRSSLPNRVRRVVDIANSAAGSQWLIWCDLNAESASLAKQIAGAAEVVGSDDPEEKERKLTAFAEGSLRVLVTKPSIAGFGMNFQSCHHMAFTGLSDSYEQFYQAVRRCWRFGQKNAVECHVVTADSEGAVVQNIKRKEAQAQALADGMTQHMAYISRGELKKESRFAVEYTKTSKIEVPKWML